MLNFTPSSCKIVYMKIIILDGYGLNPGDLSWGGFEALGSVTCYDRTAPEQRAERIGDAEIVLVNKVPLDESVFAKCPNLKYIGVLATGYNIIDLQAAKNHNICVTNIPAYSTMAVAQAVFALLLEVTNGVSAHSKSVHAGDWVKSPDFCYWKHPLTELYGKTLGIVGFGSIGSQTAKIAVAMGMNVIAFTRSTEKIDAFNAKYACLFEEGQQVKAVSFEELLKTSDIVSLHCPLTEKSKGIINTESLKLVKDGAILINTSRGPLIEEQAVADALKAKKLRAYACDVLSAEPMQAANPLLGAPNCIITPHVAWAGLETRQRLMGIAVGNLKAFVSGKAINQVN